MRTFEDKLKYLFDYQSFDPNPEIEAMMQETDNAYKTPLRLSDECLEMVAGGRPCSIQPKNNSSD